MKTAAHRADFRPWIEGGALLLVLALEFALFDRFGAPPFTKVYPRWNDQIQYLSDAYTAFEASKAHGFGPALWSALTNPTAQGTLHDVYGLLVFSVVGPSRSAALAINMFAFLGLQAALFAAVKRLWRSSALAWASSGLLLGLAAPWLDIPGSVFDFRLDWMASSLMGATLCACLLARGFRSTGWSACFGVLTALTLLTRFLTGTYFVLIYAGLACLLFFGEDRRRRAVHFLIACSLAFVLAAPVMWLSRQEILNYYWGGHFTGPESAIRNQNFGILKSISWIAEQLAGLQIGAFWLWSVAAVAVVSGILALLPRGRQNEAGPGWETQAVTLLFFLSPAVVLTLHAQKSIVVITIMLPAIVLLVLAVFGAFWRRCRPGPAALLGTAVFLGGFGIFYGQVVVRKLDPSLLARGKKINEIAVDLYERARAQGIASPKVAIDQITDTIDGQIMRVLVYERRGVWVPFQMTLPTSIAAPEERTVFERLADSDFVFITEGGRDARYPFDATTEALYPRTREWCDRNLRFLENFSLGGMQVRYYQRPAKPASQD